MKVLLAKSAGFCYGVKRAVELAAKTGEETGGCWMLGDLIHNSHVVEDLARRGVRKTEDPAGLAAGDTVVIRSHGELKSVLDDLEARGVRCVNATCPNVIRIQRLVAQAEAEGRRPVIIGEPLHPEVMGVASWCRQPLVFDGPEAVEAWLDGDEKSREIPVTVVAQTTCIRKLFETSWKIIKKQCTNVKIFDSRRNSRLSNRESKRPLVCTHFMELRFGNCSMRNLFFAHTAYQKNNQKKGKVKIISVFPDIKIPPYRTFIHHCPIWGASYQSKRQP